MKDGDRFRALSMGRRERILREGVLGLNVVGQTDVHDDLPAVDTRRQCFTEGDDSCSRRPANVCLYRVGLDILSVGPVGFDPCLGMLHIRILWLTSKCIQCCFAKPH